MNNKTRKIFRILQVLIGVPTFVYLMCWFITQQSDVTLWAPFTRGVATVFSTVGSIIVLGVLNNETDYFEDKD